MLTVKVGVAEHCLRERLDDVNAFQLKVEERNERKEDADGCCLSSCRDSLVAMSLRLLTIAGEDPGRFAPFESAVLNIELVGENPLGLADESVLGTFDEFLSGSRTSEALAAAVRRQSNMSSSILARGRRSLQGVVSRRRSRSRA
eukprot:4673772-Pleurochrysis_carterae.AAC.1